MRFQLKKNIFLLKLYVVLPGVLCYKTPDKKPRKLVCVKKASPLVSLAMGWDKNPQFLIVLELMENRFNGTSIKI